MRAVVGGSKLFELKCACAVEGVGDGEMGTKAWQRAS